MTLSRIKTAALVLSIATLQATALSLIPLSAAKAQAAASATVTFTGVNTPVAPHRAFAGVGS